MKEVDFSNFGSSKRGGNGNGVTFLRFERDKTHKIRPFGKCVSFFKLFIEKGKPSIVVDPDDKDEAAKILSEHTGREIKPSPRNAMFILDRDDGKVKILEGGFQIFEAFANWSQANGTQPGAAAGGDWAIKVEGDGVGGSNPRKYSPVYLGPSMITEDEKTMISGLKEAGKLTLSNYLKEISLDKIIETAFGGSATSAPNPQPVGATASDDVGMDW